jgi:hypothetical protein
VKALLLVAVLLVLCGALFVVGLLAPRRSRRMEEGFDRVALQAEEKSEEKGGRVGEMTERSIEMVRRAADTSAEKGREAHDKLSS